MKNGWILTGYTLLMTCLASSFVWGASHPLWWVASGAVFIFLNILAGTCAVTTGSRRLRICHHGAVLLCVFACSTVLTVAVHLALAAVLISQDIMALVGSAVYATVLLFILFWNGILCVYLTSVQLGVALRVLGVLCGWIPLVNVVLLGIIIKTVFAEVAFETQKEAVNREREAQQVCRTRYPLLLVHGVFFRDSHFLNYWGRIPAELEKNGATVYYGEHHSAASVADCAAELTARIRDIVARTGCEKVNIIAHSKGGLDCRYALRYLEAAPFAASLTTINTPHRGCLYADYLLHVIPRAVQQKVAAVYNTTLKKLGDTSPDFLAAVGDLTDEACVGRDADMGVPDGVFCQSVGSVMPKAQSGQFPLNMSYHLVRAFSGDNDGLVSEPSFGFGERYTLLTPSGKRGISHGDMVDLNRQNIEGFDVREFYVTLVQDLKERGL